MVTVSNTDIVYLFVLRLSLVCHRDELLTRDTFLNVNVTFDDVFVRQDLETVLLESKFINLKTGLR